MGNQEYEYNPREGRNVLVRQARKPQYVGKAFSYQFPAWLALSNICRALKLALCVCPRYDLVFLPNDNTEKVKPLHWNSLHGLCALIH